MRTALEIRKVFVGHQNLMRMLIQRKKIKRLNQNLIKICHQNKIIKLLNFVFVACGPDDVRPRAEWYLMTPVLLVTNCILGSERSQGFIAKLQYYAFYIFSIMIITFF